MCNYLVFRHYPITCHFRKIKTLGSTEPAGIVGGELFGSVTIKRGVLTSPEGNIIEPSRLIVFSCELGRSIGMMNFPRAIIKWQNIPTINPVLELRRVKKNVKKNGIRSTGQAYHIL